MHKRGWRVEILSWAQENGIFIALDDFYESITFMEPSRPGAELASARDSAELDLSQRPTA